MNQVLETTLRVIQNSEHVFIDQEAIVSASELFTDMKVTHWLDEAKLDFSNFSVNQKIAFVLFFNAISFSYWGSPKWCIDFNGQEYDGAWGMVMSLKRAIDEGYPILEYDYWKSLKFEEFQHHLRGNVEIPLLNERFLILKQIGGELVNNWNSDFTSLVNKTDNNAVKLVELMTDVFSSFTDFSDYLGEKVFFNKRAQLFVSDLFNMNLAKLSNIDQLTACADYKLPQILNKLGIIKYDKELSTLIDNKIEILHGSPEEVEIRACTIWAIEYLKKELAKKNQHYLSIEINDYLWLLTQKKQADDKPYHRTRTTAY